MKVTKRLEAAKEAGRRTRQQYGFFGGLVRILFGRKKVVIEKGKGAYKRYDF